MIDIAKLRELEKAATPGTWGLDAFKCIPEKPTAIMSKGPDGRHKLVFCIWEYPDPHQAMADGRLIYQMRNALPELLDRVEKAETRVLELEKALKDASYVGAGVCWCESHIGEHFPYCRQAFQALHQGRLNPEGQ